MKAKAEQYITNEGFKNKPLPDLTFTDIEGNTYNWEELHGKIVVVKFWFLNCKPCIKEIPQLNSIVKSYADKSDVVFLSFALDGEESLRSFKNKKEYLYSIISNKSYVWNTLGIRVYPTHMIINRQGKVDYVGSTKKLKTTIEKLL